MASTIALADKLKREKATEEFISLWRDQTVLWDVQNPLYRDKDERSKGLQALAEKTSLTEDAVKKKINSLRTYYSRELVTLQASSKRNEAYESKWCHFKSMAFLRNVVVPRKVSQPYENGVDDTILDDVSPSFVEYPDSASSHNYEVDFKEPPEYKENNDNRRTHNKINKFPRKRRSDHVTERELTKDEDTYIEPTHVLLSEHKTRVLDADEIFGQNVTASLRSMSDTRTKEYFKLKVQELIYQVQFGDVTPIIRKHHVP